MTGQCVECGSWAVVAECRSKKSDLAPCLLCAECVENHKRTCSPFRRGETEIVYDESAEKGAKP